MYRTFPCLLWLFIACGLLSAPAWAKTSDSVYTGTLGKNRIVMQIPSHPDGDFDGQYFYANHLVSIHFKGHMSHGRLVLKEGNHGKHFSLKFQADGTLKGVWSDSKSHSYPVVLHPAKLPPLPDDATVFVKKTRTESPYDYLRLTHLSLQRGKKQSFMGYTLQWWKEPRTKTTMFQIESGYPKAQRQRINTYLMNQLWMNINKYYDCVNAGYGFTPGGYVHQSVTPTFMNGSVISIDVVYS